MPILEIQDGIWYFTVQSTPPATGYAWARKVSGQAIETFASTTQTAVPFEYETTLEPRPDITVGTIQEFMELMCEENPGEMIYWWTFTSTVSQGSNQCPQAQGVRKS